LPDEELAEASLAKIQPDTEYTAEELKKLWRVPMGKAMQFYEQFVSEGYLKKTGDDGIVILAVPDETTLSEEVQNIENVLDNDDKYE
jgi:hypothetical protein